MFHYVTYVGGGRKERRFSPLKVGDWVKSHFRSRWQGEVLSLNPDGGCAIVRVSIARRGNPMRKPVLKQLHVSWLEKLDGAEGFDNLCMLAKHQESKRWPHR